MGRHSYDLTNDNWITPPSTDQVDAGASAELMQCPDHRAEHKPLRFRPLAHGPLLSPRAGGTFWVRVFDGLLTIAALAMFGTVALFFLVI